MNMGPSISLLCVGCCRDGKKEEEEGQEKKKVPLSLEELLAKKKAEEAAQAKVWWRVLDLKGLEHWILGWKVLI